MIIQANYGKIKNIPLMYRLIKNKGLHICSCILYTVFLNQTIQYGSSNIKRTLEGQPCCVAYGP